MMFMSSWYQDRFFFSSRRRHTRSLCDWSSDVCSSDLYEVCRRLRADAATQSIPIIMFTAKTLVDDKVTGFEAGADDYLTKPTHPAELASRVKAVLARSAAARRTANDSGLVIGILGTKGGVGTRTIALNVAAGLGQKESTIVGDIRPGQGSMGLALGLGRSAGMSNLLGRPPAEINARAIENELIAHTSGTRALLSNARPKDAQIAISPDTVSVILKGLRSLARNVVIDLGTGLTRSNLRLIKEVDQIIILTEPNRVTLNMTKELLKELEVNGIGRGRTNIVLLNRTQSTLQVPWQEAEQMLSHEMLAIISPAAELAFQATEAGMPIIVFQPTSIVATQMSKVSEEIGNRVRTMAGGSLHS